MQDKRKTNANEQEKTNCLGFGYLSGRLVALLHLVLVLTAGKIARTHSILHQRHLITAVVQILVRVHHIVLLLLLLMMLLVLMRQTGLSRTGLVRLALNLLVTVAVTRSGETSRILLPSEAGWSSG